MGREKKPWFLPKARRTEINQEADRLQRAYMGPAEEARLAELKGVTRRDFLKRLGVVAAGVTGIGTAVNLLMRDPKPRSPLQEVPTQAPEPAPLPQEAFRMEMPELLEGSQTIQAITENYNDWLRKASATELSGHNAATAMFVQLYTAARESSQGITYPDLTVEDLGSLETSIPKLNAISDAMTTKEYYVRLVPTQLPGTGGLYIAIVSGKITESGLQRTAEGQEFVHMVVNKEQPQDSIDRYITAPSAFSAITYQRTKTEKPMVLQTRWAYEQTARMRYSLAKGSGHGEKAEASRLVLHEYLNVPEDQAIAGITARAEENSLEHEKQHVADGYFSDEEAANLTLEEAVGADLINEIRGVLRAVASADPKMGMLGVYMWKYASDQINQTIGTTVEILLQTASGKSLRDLLRTGNAELSRIAQAVLRATDAWYATARSVHFNLQDSRMLAVDQQMMIELESIQRQP